MAYLKKKRRGGVKGAPKVDYIGCGVKAAPNDNKNKFTTLDVNKIEKVPSVIGEI